MMDARTLIIIGLLAFSMGCTDTPDAAATTTTLGNGDSSTSTQPTATTPPSPIIPVEDASPQDVQEVVRAGNRFAIDFYRNVKDEEGNLFFSPWSLSSALAMAYEGARGETAHEIKKVFHYPETPVLRRGYAWIIKEINSEDEDYSLDTANALWAQEGFEFLPEYLKAAGDYYGGRTTNLDFKSHAEKSRKTINSWVEEKTRDKIKDLIPQGALGPLTRLVLTNAVYFKGDWKTQFEKDDTTEQDFHMTDDKTIQVDMMRLAEDDFKPRYMENELLQALELPYAGEEISMLILLPRRRIIDLEDELTESSLNEWSSQMTRQQVHVFLPRFKFTKKSFLKKTLSQMGMPKAFTGTADFSGMTGKTDLMIDDVIHQAFIQVDEEGTEAAAATAVIVRLTSARPVEVKLFRADHPFIFLIRDNDSGQILFMGRVSNPAG